MRKNENNKRILYKIEKNLNFCDIIIMKIFKRFTYKIYRIGFNDAFNWENQNMGKIKKVKIEESG